MRPSELWVVIGGHILLLLYVDMGKHEHKALAANEGARWHNATPQKTQTQQATPLGHPASLSQERTSPMGPLFSILALGGGAGAGAAVHSWLHGTRPLGPKSKPTPTSLVAVVLECQTRSTRRQRKARTPHWKSSCQGHMPVGQRGAGAFRGTFWHVHGAMTSALGHCFSRSRICDMPT